MKKHLTIQEKAYSNIVTFLEGMLDFHSEYFDDASRLNETALSQYFFWGREIDIDDIFAYRKALVARDSTVASRAESSLNQFFANHQVAKKADDYDAWAT